MSASPTKAVRARKTSDLGPRTSDIEENRISRCFAALRAEGKKAFIAYICAGDPHLDATVELVVAMAEQGVDIIELGIPYSDPMADGPANQAACERALASGTNVRGVLEAVRRIRTRTQMPLLFFTYLSPVLAYGPERFATDAAAAGVDGLLPLDLPPEEGPEFLATMRLMEAELIEIRQGKMSLEDFFMQQMSIRGINSST